MLTDLKSRGVPSRTLPSSRSTAGKSSASSSAGNSAGKKRQGRSGQMPDRVKETDLTEGRRLHSQQSHPARHVDGCLVHRRGRGVTKGLHTRRHGGSCQRRPALDPPTVFFLAAYMTALTDPPLLQRVQLPRCPTRSGEPSPVLQTPLLSLAQFMAYTAELLAFRARDPPRMQISSAVGSESISADKFSSRSGGSGHMSSVEEESYFSLPLSSTLRARDALLADMSEGSLCLPSASISLGRARRRARGSDVHRTG